MRTKCGRAQKRTAAVAAAASARQGGAGGGERVEVGRVKRVFSLHRESEKVQSRPKKDSAETCEEKKQGGGGRGKQRGGQAEIAATSPRFKVWRKSRG